MKKQLSLILALLMLIQFIPTEVFAAPPSTVTLIKQYIHIPTGTTTTIQTLTLNTNSSPYVTVDKKYEGGSVLDKITLSGDGVGMSVVADKSTGRVRVDLKSIYHTNMVKATASTLYLKVYYKKDKIAAVKPVNKATEVVTPAVKTAKVTSLQDIVKNQTPPAKTPEQIKQENRDYFSTATENMQGLAVTLYEYYATAGALPTLPGGVPEYESRAKDIGKITNTSKIFKDSEISSFYNSGTAEGIKRKTLRAIAASYESSYETRHPALDYTWDDASETFLSMYEGKEYQQLPFIHAFNALRTAILFSDNALDGTAIQERNMGNTISDAAAFNPLFAPDADAGGDFSTRKFLANPMSSNSFKSILSKNLLLVGSWKNWKTLGQYENMSEEETKEIIKSAIDGLETMIDDAGFRKWSAAKTFNYKLASVHPVGTPEYKQYENTYNHPSKIQGWKDSLVIIQFPSAYTWGSALMANSTYAPSLYYVEVPLAPLTGKINMDIKEVNTEWKPEIGAYITEFEYGTDLMPTVPEALGEFRPQITFHVEKGVMLANSIDGLSWEMTDYATRGALTDTDKRNSVFVTWRPNLDLPATENALIYASVNLMNESAANELKTSLGSLPALDEIINEGHVAFLNTLNPKLDVNFYREVFREVDYGNNIISVAKPMPPIDLSLENVTSDYDKVKGELKINGEVKLVSSRPLELAKGELPVELTLNWSTTDGLSGNSNLNFNTFDPGTSQPFELLVNIPFPATETIQGEYNLRVNPDPINPVEPNLANNSFKGVFSDSLAVDFAAEALRETVPVSGGDGTVDIKFVAALMNSVNPIDSRVDIYRGTTRVATQNMSFEGGNPQIITFPVTEASLSPGDNVFHAVVNSNFNLTVASPFATESDLSNNKGTLTVNYAPTPPPPPPTSCDFDLTGARIDYEDTVWNPRWKCHEYNERGRCIDWEGRYEPEPERYRPKIESSLEFVTPQTQKTEGSKNGLFSDTWHKGTDRKNGTGQQYGINNYLPLAKNLAGQNATDELISKIYGTGIQLRQVIQAGSGIQVRTKIKITGTIEVEGDYGHDIVEDYVNSFKTGSLYVTGDPGKTGGSVPTYNNERKLSQVMTYDSSRAAESTLIFKEDPDIVTLGYHPETNFDTKDIYTLEFEAEIPMIISKATGTIDVDGGEKVQVPPEHKWFVYLNELDGANYQLGIEAQIRPAKLGASGGGTLYCYLKSDDFRYGISGTIFDNVNTSEDGPGGTGEWDN